MTEISQSSLDAIKTIGDAAAVAQLDGADNDRTAVLGALLHLIGATAVTTISALGVIREADYSVATQAWTIQVPGATDSDPPTQRAPKSCPSSTRRRSVDGSEQIRMFGRYEVLYGKGQRPHPNQEPSIEQLSRLKSLLHSNQLQSSSHLLRGS